MAARPDKQVQHEHVGTRTFPGLACAVSHLPASAWALEFTSRRIAPLFSNRIIPLRSSQRRSIVQVGERRASHLPTGRRPLAGSDGGC